MSEVPCYGQCMECWGVCCGCMRTWAPCICCCCMEYPYKTVPQGYQGIYQKFGRYLRTVKPGLHYINPCTETLGFIALKINVLDLARQVPATPTTEHHHQRQRLDQHRRGRLLPSNQRALRLLPSAKLQHGHRGSDLRHPQEHLRTVHPARLTGEETGNRR